MCAHLHACLQYTESTCVPNCMLIEYTDAQTIHERLNYCAQTQADVASARAEKDTERSRKWLKMQKQWTKTVNRRQEKLKRRARKGIPDAVRGQVWQVIVQSYIYVVKIIYIIM
jgi:hypothetical protein